MPGGRIMKALINVLAVLSGIAGVAILGLGILWGVDWPLWAVVLGGAACIGVAVICVLVTVLMEVPAGA
ncbi:TPA: hypothetical protein PXJ66_004383 [Yersinia enterocolitica]|nr:hypothetical protein [Yersinia enterocolitica]